MLRSLAVVLASVSLLGCGPATQTFPLEIEGERAKAIFGAVEKCARDLDHAAEVKADSATVVVSPERRIVFRFVDGAKNLSMVTSVESDGDRGALPGLKVLGDAIWTCASGASSAPTSSATATPTAAPTAQPTPSPTTRPEPSPEGTGGATPDPSAAPDSEPAPAPAP